MKFVALVQGGVRIAANADKVEWVEAFEGGATRIHFASGTAILVDEKPSDVVGKLSGIGGL